jgi:mannose-6-phosphate isomerase-like protein (cupin superfamily)
VLIHANIQPQQQQQQEQRSINKKAAVSTTISTISPQTPTTTASTATQQQQHQHQQDEYDVYDCVTETPTTTRTSTNKSTTFPAEHMEVQYTEAAATSTEVVNHRNSPSTDALRSSSHHRRDDLDHWSVTSGSTQVQFHFSQLDVSRLQKTADEPLTFIPIPVAIR